MKNIFAFLFGGLFSVGLMLSGMSNPEKVLGFLDVAGQWDPSLAFVMMGAIVVAFIPFQFAVRRNQAKTVFGDAIDLPQATQIDAKLLIGASIFGIGWGLTGVCPAPAFTLIGLGYTQILYFIVAMFIGVLVHKKLIGQ